jgi:hypothetical protein
MVSNSGYGGAGLYGLAGDGIIGSPRMNHLIHASAAYSGKDALKISLKEASQEDESSQLKRNRKSTLKASARRSQDDNVLNQSRDDIESSKSVFD